MCAPDIAPLERSALDGLERIGGRALVRRMIDAFLESTTTRLQAVHGGLATGDLRAVERAVHSLKATSGLLGARDLQQLAERMEELAVADDQASLTPLAEELERRFRATRVLLIREREAEG